MIYNFPLAVLSMRQLSESSVGIYLFKLSATVSISNVATIKANKYYFV